jgi:tripartite-type tricarboxylate transporter receptor subunit TctC
MNQQQEAQNEESDMNGPARYGSTALLLVFGLITAGAQAQAYPAKPVRIVVPTSAGGGNDFVARLAGQKLGERLNQQFVVDNRPGAGGSTATAQVARSAPDGYTLLLGFVGQLAMLPHVENVGYDPRRDFAGVSLLASGYQMLAVHPSLPVRTVKQLIALAKARPGELNSASANIYTTGHLAAELFNSAAGVKIVPIHYKGSGLAAVAVLSGEVHMIFTATSSLLPYVQSKRIVALGVTSPARSARAPEVPTLAESGVTGVETANWYALAGPAAMPKDVIGKLHGELVRISAAPDYREQLDKQGLEMQTSTPEQFAAFLQAEYDKWGKVIKSLKLQ